MKLSRDFAEAIAEFTGNWQAGHFDNLSELTEAIANLNELAEAEAELDFVEVGGKAAALSDG